MIFVWPELIRRVVEALRQIKCRIRTGIANNWHRIRCSMEMPDMASTVSLWIKAMKMGLCIAAAKNYGYTALRQRNGIAIARHELFCLKVFRPEPMLEIWYPEYGARNGCK